MEKKNKLLLYIMLFAIIGIFLTSILTFAKYFDKIEKICGTNLQNSCNTVQNSEYSNLINLKNQTNKSYFKIPLSLAGLFFYILIFSFSIFLFKKDSKNKNKNYNKKNKTKKYLKIENILLILSILGILTSIFYTIVQFYIIKAFCSYCIISTIDSIMIFILTFKRHNL